MKFPRVYLATLFAVMLCASAPGRTAGVPIDVVLMLDNSGSMMKNDPEFLSRVAVQHFLSKLEGDIRVAIVVFDEQVSVPARLTPLDASTRPALLRSLDIINFKGQFTNSPAALERSIYELKTNGRPEADKSIIFMTDGIVDTGNQALDAEKARWMREGLAAEAAEAGIRIFGIAFTDNADFLLIQSLSRKSGGEYFRAYSADEIAGVFDALSNSLTRPPLVQLSLPTTPAPPPAPEAGSGADPAQTSLPSLPTTESPAELPAAELPPLTSSNAGDSSASTLPSPALPLPALPTEQPSLPTLDAEPASADSRPSLPPLPSEDQSSEAKPMLPPEPATATDPAAPTAAAEPSTTPGPSPAPSESEPAPPQAGEPAQDSTLTVILVATGGLLLVAIAVVGALILRRRKDAAAPGGTAMPKAFLNDIEGVTERPSYELGAGLTVIGRMKGPDGEDVDYIVIDETTIGRRHAIVEYKDHSFWVADQSSLNGTFVNNRRTEGDTRLKHGDRIRFHKFEFEFLVLDMFETDRTMISDTMFAEIAGDLEAPEDDATRARG